MPPPLEPDAATLNSMSDHELMIRLWAGQVDALGIIYHRYASMVYTLAFMILTNAEEAEDLTQEVFVNLWQRQQYDPNRGSLGSYLATYTRSRALDRLRVRSNRLRILRQFQQMIQPRSKSKNPLDEVFQQERAQQVRMALDQLPDAERQVLEIAYFEGYSQSQIADRLGIPLGTVKTRSRQGLIRLRKLLDLNS